GALDLGGAQTVAGDVQHVVDAAGDPVVAIRVAPGAVAGEILAREGGEIGLDEALVVAPDGAHLARPAVEQAQRALGLAVQHLALGGDDGRDDAGQRPGRRTGLELGGAGQGRDQDAAGLGLPPGVDHRAAAVADHAVVPKPGLGIDRLADAADDPQAFAAGRLYRALALAHQRTDGGRGGVEDVDAVLVDDLPEAAGVRPGRHALEHQGGRAVGERAVD